MGRRAAFSYDKDRSGDAMVVFKPYWIASNGTTSHGSGYAYDTHVPVLLMGKGIVPGEYLQPASPTDIAPTLAFLAGITLPRASGRVLTEALEHRRSLVPAPSFEKRCNRGSQNPDWLTHARTCIPSSHRQAAFGERCLALFWSSHAESRHTLVRRDLASRLHTTTRIYINVT